MRAIHSSNAGPRKDRQMATVARISRKLITTPPPNYQNVQGPHSGTAIDDDDDADSVSTSASIKPIFPTTKLRVYRWRWFMLVSLSILNISNGMMWLTFSPIPNFTASYYNISEGEVDAFSIAFFVTALVVGLFSIYILERFGLKVTVYTGAILNFVGAAVRVLSTIEPVICSSIDKSGFIVAMVGQIFTAAAQPFLLYAPTTLAFVWFGTKERAIATGVSSLANPIGIAVVQIVSPHVVTTVSKLPLLLWIYLVPALVSGVLVLVAFWYKAPPTPPASSLLEPDTPGFLKGLWMMVKIPAFWVLLVVWGGASGMFNAFLTLLPQLLCPYGYSDSVTGVWASIMIFAGMVGAFLGGLILDYTKRFKDVAVVSYGLAILSLLWFYEVFTLGNTINIAFSLGMFGFFALPLIPACMEMGVEITYPVSAVVSSGLLWSAAQVIGIIVLTVGQSFSYPLPPNLVAINQCGSASPSVNDTSMPQCFLVPSNHSVPIPLKDSTPLTDPTPIVLFCMAITMVNFFILILFLYPKYRRVDAEKQNSFEKSVRYGAT